jgi:hypothetical protein
VIVSRTGIRLTTRLTDAADELKSAADFSIFGRRPTAFGRASCWALPSMLSPSQSRHDSVGALARLKKIRDAILCLLAVRR